MLNVVYNEFGNYWSIPIGTEMINQNYIDASSIHIGSETGPEPFDFDTITRSEITIATKEICILERPPSTVTHRDAKHFKYSGYASDVSKIEITFADGYDRTEEITVSGNSWEFEYDLSSAIETKDEFSIGLKIFDTNNTEIRTYTFNHQSRCEIIYYSQDILNITARDNRYVDISQKDNLRIGSNISLWMEGKTTSARLDSIVPGGSLVTRSETLDNGNTITIDSDNEYFQYRTTSAKRLPLIYIDILLNGYVVGEIHYQYIDNWLNTIPEESDFVITSSESVPKDFMIKK